MSLTLDIFAEQYVLEYSKICETNPWWSIPTKMKVAKERTKEYLYMKLKEDLAIEIKIWPEGFDPDNERI